eukprot:SAG11_NODE_747_length_7366_cov_7.215632_1_plen_75_part_00
MSARVEESREESNIIVVIITNRGGHTHYIRTSTYRSGCTSTEHLVQVCTDSVVQVSSIYCTGMFSTNSSYGWLG